MDSHPIGFIIVGTSARSDYLYVPLLLQLNKEIDLAGVWGRTLESARRLGEKYHLPWYTDLNRMVDELKPQAAVVSVAYDANGQVGRQVVEAGLHTLLETPIAHDLVEADAIIASANRLGLKIEVAEQYFRRPIERLKRALILAGQFGEVFTAYNDCMGHGYHGISLIRSYLGFDAQPLSVSAFEAEFQPIAHYAWVDQAHTLRREHWQHAVIQFSGGKMGVFDWSSLAYDSSLRWQRSTRFFAERGMAVGDRLTLLSVDGKDPRPVEIQRFFHNVGGMETLSSIVAHTEPEIAWQNPFRQYYMDDEMIAVADCLMSLVKAIRQGSEPEYGPLQARRDQELALAMQDSAASGGAPVRLPVDIP